ncbi:MAG: flagellin FliC [Deltaproteobacteria bacterium]|nr:flagellin FliC [Deltaproteobacteria bacterium]
MSLQINTNVLALNAQRNLETVNERLNSTIARLSSGSRIVHASDDAAGLAISDQINSTTRSLGQAIRNAQDGISLVQVYEGGTTEINTMLMRIRELAMSAASDTVGEAERRMLDYEVQNLKQEVDRVAKTTKYAGSELLSGKVIELEFQVGTSNNPEVDRIRFAPGDTNLTASALEIGDVEVTEKAHAQESLDQLDIAISKVNEIRARVGSVQSRLNTTISSQGVFQENLLAAKSRLRDADIAVEATNLAKESILRKAGVAVLMQANETPTIALQLLRS